MPGERGQGMLEYGLLIVLVAIIVMVLLVVVGSGTGNMFSNVTVNI
jgi:pilus assembly protein Flp/PilA